MTSPHCRLVRNEGEK